MEPDYDTLIDDASTALEDALHALTSAAKGPYARPSRELSLAVTKVEEAQHWLEAVKA